MKSVTASVPFTFKYSATKTFSFSEVPELATDVEAKVIERRFGANVTITNMDQDETVVPQEEVVPVAEPAPLPEPLPEDALAAQHEEPEEVA